MLWESFEEALILLSDDRALLLNQLEIVSIDTHLENIAGVEVPVFDQINFSTLSYRLTDTPAWFDVMLDKLKSKARLSAMIAILLERKKSDQ